MKIAIYHNEDIHFEMLGYLLEYCYTYDVEVHIYSSFTDGYHIGETYSSWYNKFFQKTIEWKTGDILESGIEYDVLFLITDDNPSYSIIKDRYSEKTISINHWHLSRCESRVKVGTRQFYNRLDSICEMPYAMPCYNIISEQDKFELIKTKTRLQVVFVGRFNVPNSFTFAFFNKFEDIDFHLIIWKTSPSYFKFLKEIPNFHVHVEIETEDMMNLMKNAHYVFFNPSYIEGYLGCKTSATLHLALSTLAKPIIPKSWNQYYKFDTNVVIEYDDLQFLTPDGQLNLTIDDYFQSLKFLSIERRKQIANRNIVFDNAIKTITGVEPKSIKSSWVSNLFSRLCLSYPKVFIGIETCFEEKVIDDFREVHIINSVDTECIISNKVYSYTGTNTVSLLGGIIDSFFEPVLFMIDENVVDGDNYYSDIFNMISSRNFNDIIIINFSIKLEYIQCLKNYSIYQFNNQPYIILIPKLDTIEKDIFQVCIKPFNHKKIPVEVIDKIKDESVGYAYTLYDTNMILNMIDDLNPVIKRKYESCMKTQHKKDILQMVMLYNKGGIYVDIDCQPLTSFDNIIKRTDLNPTFVGVLGVNRNDGLAIGLMACSKYNKIIGMILNELNASNFDDYVNTDYGLICRMVGFIMKRFMEVEELTEGFYEIKGERILLLNEIWNEGDYSSCKILYKNEVLANTRYVDYPWNLNDE
jgi:hypothetical protein